MFVFRYSGYLLAMLTLPFLAWLYPELGSQDGPLYPSLTTKIALMLVFVLQGLTWEPQKIRRSIPLWKAHLFLQTFVFIAMPLAALAILQMLPWWMADFPAARTGLIILSVLPTTVASCTVFTRDAGGNAGLTLLNSVLNNLLAIFVTPTLLAVLLSLSVPLSPLALIQKLLFWLAVPFAVGWGLKPWIKIPRASFIARMALKFIQYTVLCNGVLLIQSTERGWWMLGSTLLVVGPWFFLSFIAGFGAARSMHFSDEDVKACTFTAPQKTLAVGAPLIQSLAGQNGFDLALMQLPLLVYYYVQMVSCIGLADYYAWKRATSSRE